VASIPRNRTGARGSQPAKIIELAHDHLVITELTPNDNRFIGKEIRRDGSVSEYPKVYLWDWTTAAIPATPIALFNYLREVQQRNVCLIRGLPKQGLQRKGVRRLNENFFDEPTQLQFFDVDGTPADWQADPEAAVKDIVQRLGEPWASASFVWFFSSTHGLVTEKVKIWVKDKDGEDKEQEQAYWRGEIGEGTVRARLAFILDQPLKWQDAADYTKALRERSGVKLDPAISRQVQPNYTARIKWHAQPGCDVLGDDIKRIGWVKGAHDLVSLPPWTAQEVRWARAEGRDPTGCRSIAASPITLPTSPPG
jgi:hypothetical protein